MEKLSDEELQAKTDAFKERYRQGETLQQLLPEAFAIVKRSGKTNLGGCDILMSNSSGGWYHIPARLLKCLQVKVKH